jgi:hypothetical protein
MSVVTGVTIIAQSCSESLDVLIQQLNDWIANDPPCGGGRLFQVDQYYGGGKHPENFVWGGGFNYLSWREFVEYAKTLPWKDEVLPEEQRVILIVSPDQTPAEVHWLA